MLPISSQNIYAPGCHIALLTEGGPAPTPWSTNISLLTEGGPASTPWSINVALPDGGRARTQACFYFFKY